MTMKQTGRAAAAAGILMLAGVEGEWLLNPQADDGTVTNTPVFAILLVTATTGFVLLLLAVRALRAHTAGTRTARVGSLITLAGAALMVAFGASTLASTLVTGSPLEIVFLAFLIGVLLLAIGSITWALAARRQFLPPGAWQMLPLSGVAAFAALALEADPWHDLSLAVMFAAWTILGVLILRMRTVTAPASPARIDTRT